MKLLLCLVISAFAQTNVDLAKAIQFPVEKYTLANGLTVLLHPDNTIPAVSVRTWYRVGSKDENVGRTGLAHFFEHMMFKGTKAFPADTWGQFLKGKGAEMNASTSFDYTNYYIDGPAEHTQLFLQIEADRMRNLLLDPKDVNSEREVVKEERRMRYDDSIEGGIHEAMYGLMYQKLPYRWLPIGSMTDLNAASMDDLHAFYKQFYSPNNAVLVVAGAIDVPQTKAWIEKYYGGLPRETITRPKLEQEPEQKSIRRTVIQREAQAPTVAINYHLPELRNEDHFALDLLAIVLGQGNSSRLYQELVRKRKIATTAYAGSYGQALAGDFTVYVALKPGQNPETAVAAVEDVIAKIRKTPPSEKEFNKASNILMKGFVDTLKKVSGRARILATYETMFGDYTRIFTDLKKYQDVTPKDLTRVAKAYLGPNQRNIVTVAPKKAGGKK